jgi:hypothetical protein
MRHVLHLAHSRRRIVALVLIGVLLSALVIVERRSAEPAPLLQPQPAAAQDDGRSTPAPVQLPTDTPTVTPPPPTPTRTATSEGPASVESRAVDNNVRSGPGTEFDRLGTISPGTRYTVIGRLGEWLQINYPDSPTRTAWVFSGVVQILGDEERIPDLSQQDVPTIDPNIAAAAETQLAITRTPGGLLTLTAEVGSSPEGLFTATPQPSLTLVPGERLPTFTVPPFTFTPIPIEQLQQPVSGGSNADEPFAPAIPVLGLIGLGMLGLFVGILRRV